MESVADESRSCYRCNYETTEPLAKCPQCGQRLRTAATVRRLGWVLIIIGGLLVAFMGWLTFGITGIIAHSDEPGAPSRFTGGPEMVLAIYGIFGFVILFGLVAMAGGIWQVKYGKRNKKLAYLIFGLGIVFIIIGWLVRLSR